MGQYNDMSAEDEVETERTAVKTYIPIYQKQIWTDHAAQLGMSQSEFVRAMVQAGRRGFEPSSVEVSTDGVLEGGSTDATPGVEGLETRVLDILSEAGSLDWDELVERLAGDFEDRLDDTLDELQESNQVKYSGRHGGYTLTSE